MRRDAQPLGLIQLGDVGKGMGYEGGGGEASPKPNPEQNGDSWYKPDGSLNYPPNNGAVPGTEAPVQLQPGQVLGRYGNIGPNSDFVTAPGATPDSLSLPPTTDASIYHDILVLKPIPWVVQSTVAPWGGATGQGVQYLLPYLISWLEQEGYVVIVGN